MLIRIFITICTYLCVLSIIIYRHIGLDVCIYRLSYECSFPLKSSAKPISGLAGFSARRLIRRSTPVWEALLSHT